jgi:hypothetical protein
MYKSEPPVRTAIESVSILTFPARYYASAQAQRVNAVWYSSLTHGVGTWILGVIAPYVGIDIDEWGDKPSRPPIAYEDDVVRPRIGIPTSPVNIEIITVRGKKDLR